MQLDQLKNQAQRQLFYAGRPVAPQRGGDLDLQIAKFFFAYEPMNQRGKAKPSKPLAQKEKSKANKSSTELE